MFDNAYLEFLTQSTPSIFWHDSALEFEQEAAFANGATGMTTNPFLVNATLRQDPARWAPYIQALPPDTSGDDKSLALTKAIAAYYAQKFDPLFREGRPGGGYVCAQVNPKHTGDCEIMLAQAKEIAQIAPNVVVKLPATMAGIDVLEECVALGYNVAATLSFTVPQVLAVGEARERGKKRAEAQGIRPGLGIAVLMVGRLDDYLRDVAHDRRAPATESDIRQAGLACIKRAYSIYEERGYDTYIMPAGCRGGYHIEALAGARMIMSIAPKVAAELRKQTDMREKISEPIASDVIDRLMTMEPFHQAYEVDGMKPEEFITFGSCNRTTTQFIECGWNPAANV